MKQEDAIKIIDDLFEKYEKISDETLPLINLDGSRLKESLANQIEIMIQWECMYSEVRHMHEVILNEEEESYSDAVKTELSDSFKKQTITEAKEFAKCNKRFREWKRIRLDISNLMNEVKAILEVVQSRKYILNNITTAVCASQENHII